LAFTPTPSTYMGRHVLAEFFECNANVLNNPALVEQLMKEAANACGATIVQSCFHRFSPYGVSGVVVIQESHLAIHTWPENGYASVDLYTCGETCDPHVAFEFLRETLHSAHTCYTELHRGLLSSDGQSLVPVPPMLVGTKEVCQKPVKAEIQAGATRCSASSLAQAVATADVSGGR
jgi:S-adenosylmethionine decarboxylase